MVPVLVATVVALYAHNLRSEGEQEPARPWVGPTPLVRITPYTKAQGGLPDGWMYIRPGETMRGEGWQEARRRRPVTDVDLTSAAAGRHSDRRPLRPLDESALPSGGTAYLQYLDGDDPLVAGLFPGIDGKAPEKADEAAIRRSMAEELGLLDDGEPGPTRA